MTKKIYNILIVSCIFLSAGWASCKKAETISTPTSKIVGKWKKVQFATDDNANGQLEESEIVDVAPGNNSILEFKNDNTGAEYSTHVQDLPFRWEINGELSLMIVYNAGDTIVNKITQINAAHLNLTVKTKKGLVGYYYDTYKE